MRGLVFRLLTSAATLSFALHLLGLLWSVVVNGIDAAAEPPRLAEWRFDGWRCWR